MRGSHREIFGQYEGRFTSRLRVVGEGFTQRDIWTV